MKKLTQTWRQQKPGSFPRNAAKEEAHEQLSNGATRTKRLGRLPVAVTSRKVVAAVSNTGKDHLQNGSTCSYGSSTANSTNNSSFMLDLDEDLISAVELMEQDVKTGKSPRKYLPLSKSPLVCSTPKTSSKGKNQNGSDNKQTSGKVSTNLSERMKKPDHGQVGVILNGKRRREPQNKSFKKKDQLSFSCHNKSLTPSNSPADKKKCSGLVNGKDVQKGSLLLTLMNISVDRSPRKSSSSGTHFTAIKNRSSENKRFSDLQQESDQKGNECLFNDAPQENEGISECKQKQHDAVDASSSSTEIFRLMKNMNKVDKNPSLKTGSCQSVEERHDELNKKNVVKTSSRDLESCHMDKISSEETSKDKQTENISSLLGAPSESSDRSRLLLSSWGLPEPVLKRYHSAGVTQMFDWQADCLCTGNVLDGGNLVYAAPTSAGKTMVAELLILKRVLETRKKALFILPFVSVTREKMFSLQQLYEDAGIRVGGFMGGFSPPGGFNSVDVAVCTIEKGNSLVNRLIEEKNTDQLGIIVVDELHMVGDSHRGYLLELLLTKIAYVANKGKTGREEKSCKMYNPVQIVGMSATLPNLDLLARWLHADIYRTDFRPVPLTECLKLGATLYDVEMRKIGAVNMQHASSRGDEDHIVPLCLETVLAGHAVLIFCPTKNWCEKLCETIAKEFYHMMKHPVKGNADKEPGFQKASDLIRIPLNSTALRDVFLQLQRTPVGVDNTLAKTVPYGVAFHHAGLTFDERDIIEGAFRNGSLKVLVATSTLSSGVNLPARRVIIRSVMFHGRVIDALTYKQMAGRAGRKGVDTAGECILVCKPNEKTKATNLMKSELAPVKSCLVRDDHEGLSSCMKRAILEIVVSGVAVAPGDVAAYASCTMLAASMSRENSQTEELIDACIQFLQENEFVLLKTETNDAGVKTERFFPTQLGSAVLASALSPDEGLSVFAELQKARRCFVLESELHVIYLVTPIYSNEISSSIDWYQFYCVWEKLCPSARRVADLVGVTESFIARAVRGRIPTTTDGQLRSLAVHRRFFTSLVLLDLVSETPLPEVARCYGCNKGQLQSLQQSAATFAGMVTVFCGRLGWYNLELILSQFQNRLTFGIQRELCDLVRVSLLNGQRARTLYNGGYQTVASLARADCSDVENLLKTSAPFQSTKRSDGESEWELAERRKAHCIWLTGKKGVTESEAAQAIISEAKSIIEAELGGVGIQWKSSEIENQQPNTVSSEPDQTGHMVSKQEEITPVLSKQEQTTPVSSGQDEATNKRNSSGNKSRTKRCSRLMKKSPSYLSDSALNNSNACRSFVGKVLSPPPAMRRYSQQTRQSPLDANKVNADTQNMRNHVVEKQVECVLEINNPLVKPPNQQGPSHEEKTLLTEKGLLNDVSVKAGFDKQCMLNSKDNKVSLLADEKTTKHTSDTDKRSLYRKSISCTEKCKQKQLISVDIVNKTEDILPNDSPTVSFNKMFAQKQDQAVKTDFRHTSDNRSGDDFNTVDSELTKSDSKHQTRKKAGDSNTAKRITENQMEKYRQNDGNCNAVSFATDDDCIPDVPLEPVVSVVTATNLNDKLTEDMFSQSFSADTPGLSLKGQAGQLDKDDDDDECDHMQDDFTDSFVFNTQISNEIADVIKDHQITPAAGSQKTGISQNRNENKKTSPFRNEGGECNNEKKEISPNLFTELSENLQNDDGCDDDDDDDDIESDMDKNIEVKLSFSDKLQDSVSSLPDDDDDDDDDDDIESDMDKNIEVKLSFSDKLQDSISSMPDDDDDDDESRVLVAASDYDRVNWSSSNFMDSTMQDGNSDSYTELHIQSKAAKHKHDQALGHMADTAIINNDTKAKIVSVIKSCETEYNQSISMSDSFSCSMADVVMKNVDALAVSKTNSECKINRPNREDSWTFSMMEKVLDDQFDVSSPEEESRKCSEKKRKPEDGDRADSLSPISKNAETTSEPANAGQQNVKSNSFEMCSNHPQSLHSNKGTDCPPLPSKVTTKQTVCKKSNSKTSELKADKRKGVGLEDNEWKSSAVDTTKIKGSEVQIDKRIDQNVDSPSDLDSVQDISSGSDCLPPTPPDDRKVVMSPRLRYTPARKARAESQQRRANRSSKSQELLNSWQTKLNKRISPKAHTKLKQSSEQKENKKSSGENSLKHDKKSGFQNGSRINTDATQKINQECLSKEDADIYIDGKRSSVTVLNNKDADLQPSCFEGERNSLSVTNNDFNKLHEIDFDGELAVDMGDKPGDTDMADTHGAPDVGDKPGAPDVGDKPGAPDVGDTPGAPDVGDKPGAPDVADTPGAPEVADTHEAPDLADGCDETFDPSLLTQQSFTIVDVCADRRLFDRFVSEWRARSRYALCVACERKPGTGIGENVVTNTTTVPTSGSSELDVGDSCVVVGLAVSWENRDTYYMSLTDSEVQGDPNDSLAPPPLDQTLTVAQRLKAIKPLLENSASDQPATVDVYDVKSQYAALCRGCGVQPSGRFQDPRVAHWLLDPGARELNLHGLVTNFIPSEIPLLQGVGGSAGRGSLGLAAHETGTGRYRATVESVLAWKLMDYFLERLHDEALFSAFSSVEMPAIIVMARMDLNGFGFSEAECESQKNLLLSKMSALEEQAYQVAGHTFSLSSTEDVAQILYTELQLPINGDPKAAPPPLRTLGPNRRGVGSSRGRGKTSLSTSKEVLEKLKPLHPLPGVVLEWRRVTNALTKHVFPLQKEKVFCSRLHMYRVFSECQFHTATGRVSMSEPNLQNVPKDFQIALPDVIGESPTGNGVATNLRSLRKSSRLRQEFAAGRQVSRVTENSTATSVAVSMRHAFIPFKGAVMLAADYSQLELRMIAHLSQDRKLISILNNDGDVFKMIAAQWKCSTVEEITAEQRQQAKQICYGMLYGIGPKALGEQIEVDENEAAVFMETFKSKYPGLRTYLRTVVQFCREKGFVETIAGRRRYLSTITDTKPYARAQAERQAVNTTVQGSAADLVKTAMVRIDAALREMFPDCHLTHRHRIESLLDNRKSEKRSDQTSAAPTGAFPVLQLHDELIYEVSERELTAAAQLIRYHMEHAMKLRVRLPVKLKAGPSWGKLEDYN